MFEPQLFAGKKAMIFGVANERSLAWSIAKQLHRSGAKVGFNFMGEALERRVRPLAESVQAEIVEQCDVTSDEQIDAIFKTVEEKWGGLDYLIHSVAYANRSDLEGRFIDTTRDGFLLSINISAYSLVALAKRAEPLMKEGGSILTLSYYGAVKVIPNYNVMGVSKATLEACVRYLANDLGTKKIRVNAISAGPVKTLAASGVRNFKNMLALAAEKAPIKENITGEEVGAMAAFLCSPASQHVTGTTMYIDSGAHILGG